jgi:hypothetical protein
MELQRRRRRELERAQAPADAGDRDVRAKAPPLGLVTGRADHRFEDRRLNATEASGGVRKRHREDVWPPRRQPERPVDGDTW